MGNRRRQLEHRRQGVQWSPISVQLGALWHWPHASPSLPRSPPQVPSPGLSGFQALGRHWPWGAPPTPVGFRASSCPHLCKQLFPLTRSIHPLWVCHLILRDRYNSSARKRWSWDIKFQNLKVTLWKTRVTGLRWWSTLQPRGYWFDHGTKTSHAQKQLSPRGPEPACYSQRAMHWNKRPCMMQGRPDKAK